MPDHVHRCYFCDSEIPPEDAKRCSRCRVVVYCSKDCQATSWKAGHKHNCRPHPSVVLPNGEIRTNKPKKGTRERFELDMDMRLTEWIARWRPVFHHYTKIALDLPNHTHNRPVTHCLLLTIVPEPDVPYDKIKEYDLEKADVVTTSYIEENFPEIGQVVVDPADHTRLRFFVLLKNADEERMRLRHIQWSEPNLDSWRDRSNVGLMSLQHIYKDPPFMKDGTPAWEAYLRTAVATMYPEDVPIPGSRIFDRF